jgi:hypothetical protein
MAVARGPTRGDRVVAGLLGLVAAVLASLAAWGLAIGDFVPGFAFAIMTGMLGIGIFVLLRVKAADATAAQRQAAQDRRDRNRLERIDHGGIDSGSGSNDAVSTSSSSSSDGGTETGRSG